MGEGIIVGVISGIISGIVLILIERLLVPKDESLEAKKELYVNEPQQIVIKEKIVYRDSGGASNNDSSFVVIMGLLLLGVTIIKYIEYTKLVHGSIIVMSLAIGIMAMGMAFYCIRKGMRFRKDLNVLLVHNIFALIAVPFLIFQTNKGSEKWGIDMEVLRQQVIQTGKLPIFEDSFDFFFLGYQILGLAFIVLYMLFVLISNIYLVALININLNSRLRKMWLFLNRKTYRIATNTKMTILISAVFLILSYLMVSGIILDLIKA